MTSGDAITIATNNATIDCNGFKIGGVAGGAGTAANGVRGASRFNTTIRNCNIRGFFRGVYLTSGGGHLVEDNGVDGNTAYGMYVVGPGSTIRNNPVIDNGGSTVSTGAAVGINAANGVDILDNTVNGVAAIATNASAFGIRASFNGDGSISGNRVRGLAPTGSNSAYGIYSTRSGCGMIRDNDVQGPSVAGIRIYCSSNTAAVRCNVVAGFATGIFSCYGTSNDVNSN